MVNCTNTIPVPIASVQFVLHIWITKGLTMFPMSFFDRAFIHAFVITVKIASLEMKEVKVWPCSKMSPTKAQE